MVDFLLLIAGLIPILKSKMATKYKATGCTKFLLVLLILIPLSYFGARIITGEDPLANVYPLFQNEKESENDEEETLTELPQEEGDDKENKLSSRIQRLEVEVEKLKKELQSCQEKEASKNQN